MRFRSLLVASGLALQANAAAAGSFSSCKEPFAYDSAVNVYALADTPENPSQFDAPTAATGERLAFLVKLDTLFNSSFGSLGVHFLHQRDAEPPCTLGEVAARVADVLPQAGAAMVTTHHLFADDGRILLQTYLRFLESTGRAPLQLELRDGAFTFEGDLPARAMAFTPRLVSRADFEMIAGRFEVASRIYAAPDTASHSNELPLAPEEAVPISVVDMRGDGWLEVRSESGLNGWLRADPVASKRLRALLPELELLEAIAGYLSLDTGSRWDVLPEEMIVPRVTRLLKRFLSKVEEPAPQAVAAAILADLALFRQPRETATSELVLKQLVAAVRARPEDAELRNLLALSRLAQCCKEPPPTDPESRLARITQISAARQDLQAATKLAPNSQHILDNQYELLEVYDAEGADLEALKRELLAEEGSRETWGPYLLAAEIFSFPEHERAQQVAAALDFAEAHLPASRAELEHEIQVAATLAEGRGHGSGPDTEYVTAGAGDAPQHIAALALARGVRPSASFASLTPPEIRFAFDSAELTPDAKEFLDELAVALNSSLLRDHRFQIVGHTDAIGPEAYNLNLSQRRAEAVATYLTRKHGISHSRLVIQGFGEAHPIHPNNPFSDVNRRVEFINLGPEAG